jgi:FtsP/CotA-like multicopper oxidase with cupredoxin domain
MADPSKPSPAIPAPQKAYHLETLNRRALLGGAAAAMIWPLAGQAADAPQAVPLSAGPLGYDGASPGPVLRGQVGQALRLTLANARDAPTSLVLQGLRVDPDPGFPGLGATPVAPGARRTVAFTPSEPGFGLYGDYGGLVGAVVVPEATSPAVDFERVVVFTGDPAAPRANGAPLPLDMSAPPAGRVRLRLANALPDTLLALSTNALVLVVAIDGQPCEIFAPRAGEFPLCPTARFDLLFDLPVAGAEFRLGGVPAVRIVALGSPPSASRWRIAPLQANPRLPKSIALERAVRATFRLTDRRNGSDWPRKPLFEAKRGQPVVLTLTNDTPDPQTLRLEGHWARLLHGLDDGWDPYWRDALYMELGQTLHAAFVADRPGKWPLASASPERRAKGLATWFRVS